LEACWDRTRSWAISHPSAIKIHEAIGKMIATDIQPIQMVENSGFRQLVQLLEPRYVIPSRKYFSDQVLPGLFNCMKEKILLHLREVPGIAFTVDIWTADHTTQSFMSLTAHWLTYTFGNKAAALHCEAFDGQHTAAHIGSSFLQMLAGWGISKDQCQIVLHDNGRNIVKAFKDLQLPHASCITHTLQLVIGDGFAIQDSIDQALNACRKIVGHFKHSAAATTRLRELQVDLNVSQHQLVQDVSTRWNSTFYMLQRLLEQRLPISVFCSESEAVSNLTPVQWTLLEGVVHLLRPFEEITRNMSSETACISLVIPTVKAISAHLEKDDTHQTSVRLMRTQLLASLKRRLGALQEDSLYSVATLLDPRFKLRCFNTEAAKKKAVNSLTAAAEQINPASEVAPPVPPFDEIVEPAPQRRRVDDLWSCLDDLLSDPRSDQLPSTGFQKELATYVSEGLLPRLDDPCLWWRDNRERFPSLAHVARRYLASPPSSVPSERLFSAAGDVVSDHRCSLLPENAERLILLKFNMNFI
jgi:hypothetical protein